MITKRERHLFGPNLALIGLSALEVHQVKGHPQNNAFKTSIGHRPSMGFESICDHREGIIAAAGSPALAHGLCQEGTAPPELFDRQGAVANILVGHGALTIVTGNRVWAVKPDQVEEITP